MSDKRCGILSAHEPHSWGDLNWCPGSLEPVTVTLSEFLLARFAEDETVARAASPGPWHVNAESDIVLAVDDIEVCDGFALSGPQTRATTQHIARHDPARVLAECEAKRRIVHEYEAESSRGPAGQRTDFVARHGGILDAYSAALRLLALPYADHPDYREEWRP